MFVSSCPGKKWQVDLSTEDINHLKKVIVDENLLETANNGREGTLFRIEGPLLEEKI